MRRWLMRAMMAAWLTAPTVWAQSSGTAVPAAAPQAAGTVIGTVIAQDTQRPVRFAQVQLQLAASGANGGDFAGFVTARTDIDGTFVAENVTPGDYYVSAVATGYIAERALLQAQAAAGADTTALLNSLPIVHVAANATSNVNVSLQRGGALAGHVEWEDGSPAAGVSLQAALSNPVPLQPAAGGTPRFAGGGGTPFAQTDDRGNFRMSGLATGDYVVSATLQPASPSGMGRGGALVSAVRIYAPGVFRRPKAEVVSVRAGDERTDLRLVLDLRGLHAVSGTVGSASAGQSIQAGRVTLTDPNDSSLQIQTSITPRGTFRLPYVPPGSYMLQVNGASTTPNAGFGRRGGSTPGVAFQPFSQALVVAETDVTGVAITLTPVPPAAAPQ